MMDYIKRMIDATIELKLQVTGGVVIKGPKWCGKTTTAKQFAKSVLDLQSTKTLETNKRIAENDISLLLKGESPRLIDEWQVIRTIWNAVRTDIDERNEPGLYILTGSTTPVTDKSLHTGIGRLSFIEMKTMSLFESGESNGTISLKDIVDGTTDIHGQKSDISYGQLAYLTCRGGWPSAIHRSETIALEIAKEYVNGLCESDISNIDDRTRNPALTRLILRAYARHISTIDSNTALYDDVRALYGDITDQTLIDYIDALKRLYVVDEVMAWNPNLRSKTSIRTSPKKSFVDPSIGIAALDISPKQLALDPNTFGLFFENLVNRDLSVYANKMGGYVRHYRDRSGLECDHVIHFNNGKYGLIQTKLGSDQTDQGVEKLRELRDLIREKNRKSGKTIVTEPDFYMVINGGETAFTTTDGIFVVPIGCLRD
jgi:predicted AAA+ superfamily ATPase